MKKIISLSLAIVIAAFATMILVGAIDMEYTRPTDLPYGELLFTEDFSTKPAGKMYGSGEVIDLNDTEDGFVRLGGRWDDNLYFILDGTEQYKDNVIISLDGYTPNVQNGLIYGLSLFKSNNEGFTAHNSGLDVLWCENQGVSPTKRPGNDQSTQFGDLTGKTPNADPHNFTAMIADGVVKLYYDGKYLNDYSLSDLTIDDYAIGATVYATWFDLDKLQIWSVAAEEETSTDTSDFTAAAVILASIAIIGGATVVFKRRGAR